MVDPRIFTQGRPVLLDRQLRLPIRKDGVAIDFIFCDFDMVVTSSSLNDKLEVIAGSAIQRIPIEIDPKIMNFEILNICELVECIDETKSQFMKWTEHDGRPDKVGSYRMITKLKIDPKSAYGHQIFRIEGWPLAIIISQQVKDLFEAHDVHGLRYERVG